MMDYNSSVVAYHLPLEMQGPSREQLAGGAIQQGVVSGNLETTGCETPSFDGSASGLRSSSVPDTSSNAAGILQGSGSLMTEAPPSHGKALTTAAPEPQSGSPRHAAGLSERALQQ